MAKRTIRSYVLTHADMADVAKKASALAEVGLDPAAYGLALENPPLKPDGELGTQRIKERGFRCPFFGQEFLTVFDGRETHHLAKCGHKGNGIYPTKSGFEFHTQWLAGPHLPIKRGA